jgi:hypothetical protein
MTSDTRPVEVSGREGYRSFVGWISLRIHRSNGEEWYRDVPFTDLRMACAYRLIHPTKVLYQIESICRVLP